MTNCRSCGHTPLESILDLGRMPLANGFLDAARLPEPEQCYPLELVFCPRCALVQITETVPPEQLFRNYLYFSSFSDTALQSARSLTERLVSGRSLERNSLAVEIASNDGYLLQYYRSHGIPVLGIEPARNIARIAEERGIPTIPEFFGTELAMRLLSEGRIADVIHANNVIAHVADLHGVVQGMRVLLKEDGVAIVENHYVRDLIERVEFDSIYHEHLCYYSATSFRNLFASHGLTLVDVEELPVHGGSLRVYFQRTDGPCSLLKEGSARVQARLDEEAEMGMLHASYYKHFARRVDDLRASLISLLAELRAMGKRIAVYGASAKSTTLLNYFGIDGSILEFVVDRSTAKQGLYTPGTHLPILAPEVLLERQPDYTLLLAWNLADEVLAQQADYRRRGGRFIVPIPQLKVL